MGPPGFLEKLSKEDRERFTKAEAVARGSDGVKVALRELESIQKEDELFRDRRLEAHRRMRKELIAAMVSADPGLKEMLQEWDFPSGGKASRKGKGPEKSGKANGSRKAKKE
jgi:hypothetical protein